MPKTIFSAAAMKVNCFTSSKCAFVSGTAVGFVCPSASCATLLSPHPYTTALEPTTLGNCPFAAASAALSGNVGFDHQSTASTVLTPVRVVHFAEHARRKRDTAESYTLIVIVSVLSALHSPFESRKMYVTTVEYDVSVGESTHGAAYDIVVCPASTRAVTSGLHASVVADGNSVSKASTYVAPKLAIVTINTSMSCPSTSAPGNVIVVREPSATVVVVPDGTVGTAARTAPAHTHSTTHAIITAPVIILTRACARRPTRRAASTSASPTDTCRSGMTIRARRRRR
mmetsp:Transcript_5010/g.16812  ORF Transcript_5010/g.16812 Transcript_5010/m.16812 type:complete len:286 (+) Transcript_5010:4068-4925(+)